MNERCEQSRAMAGGSSKVAKRCASAAFALLLCGGLCGCSDSVETEHPSETDTVSSEAVDGMDFEYTSRDLDPSYDEASAVKIELSGLSAIIEGDGASSDGSTVTVSSTGTYILSGSLDDGQIVVEAGDDDKVQIVLDGASIHNEDGPALYVKNADKCFVTLADGSENELSDEADYVLEDDSDEPYATLFSKDDLTLNGSGSLTAASLYRHAVRSKDDLVITGGTYVIDAAEDALRGRDCVKICDGDFTLTAVGDGIKSNNDEDAVRGFVSIDGGAFSISAGDDGIQAETYLRTTAGTLQVVSADDALHSNGEALIAGGTLSIDAVDDAVHAETVLTIGDGVDSNGGFEVNGGVLLVSGPASGDNGAFDYDTSATANGGTVIAVGSRQMAQNFTGGEQPFAYADASGSGGQSVAVVADDGTVLCSFTPVKGFESVVVTCPGFSEGQSYSLVIGGTVSGANEDGYLDAEASGTVSGGESTSLTASTTASGGMGGLGSDGGGMPAGQPGEGRPGGREGFGQDRGDAGGGAPEGAPDGAPSEMA